MNPNSGSFGAPSGGNGAALADAMGRRGMDASVLDQVTPGAPTAANRAPAPTVQQGAPAGIAAPQAAPSVMPTAGQPGGPPSGESGTIVKALDSRLKTLSKLQESGISI